MNVLIALSPILLMLALAIGIGFGFYLMAKRSRPEKGLEQRVAALEEEVRRMKAGR